MEKGSKDKKANWGKLGGPTGQMHKFAPTGTQTPDRTSQEGHSGSRRDIAAKGGGKVGFYSSGASNKDYAGCQEPGTTAATKCGGNDKFASGGSTKMFGNRGSQRAEAGKTSP